ncbi:hypothetical protein SBA7_300042 [Candidatus Sulfotelmatobacter sp. SbA7]|nr:hypothetical protein SBA7_300042 [Candidatus Sulfotelmatobacter sp. SbA7]
MGEYKFNLRDAVRRIGQHEVRTVQQIRDNPPGDPLYFIQLGTDFATSIWAKESELGLVASASKPDSGPGFYPAKSVTD